jgi:hypothetical protein
MLKTKKPRLPVVLVPTRKMRKHRLHVVQHVRNPQTKKLRHHAVAPS